METTQVPPKEAETAAKATVVEEHVTHKIEEKTTGNFYLPEAQRLIKAGYPKKAYTLLEKHIFETENIPTILKIRICRRMMASLTKICNGSLIKGDIQNIDKFVKIMEKANSCLFLWHELMKTYVTKTNTRFEHLHGYLAELADSSDEELNAMNLSKSRKSSQYINRSFDSVGDTGDQKASMFEKKLKKKKKDSISTPLDSDLIDDTFNFLGGPSIKVDVFNGKEMNVSFVLDEFIKYLLQLVLNWALFFKKIMKKPQAALRFLILSEEFSKAAEQSLNPNLLNVVAKIRIVIAVFYLEFGRTDDALKMFENTINVLQVEFSLRMNRSKGRNKSKNLGVKLKKTVRLLVSIFLNTAIIYEQQENYPRILESLKIALWFTTKYLSPDEELYKAVVGMYDAAIKKYDKYLKELGEIERIAQGDNMDLIEQDPRFEPPPKIDHFTKINEHLYKKFHYEHLNATQYVVFLNNPKTAPNKSLMKTPQKKTMFETTHEDVSTHNKTADVTPNKPPPLKDLHYDTPGVTKSTQNYSDALSPSTKYGLSPHRSTYTSENKRRKLKKALDLSVEEINIKKYKLMSEKYRNLTNPEEELTVFNLDDDEEEKHIIMLNQNIKRSHRELIKKSATSTGLNPKSTKSEYTDIDKYFQHVMEKKIQQEDRTRKMLDPTQFKSVVKNYAYFLKNEDFDKKEFKFANKMVASKNREDLGEPKVAAKYTAPPFKIAELQEMKSDAYLHEVRIEVERRVAEKNLHYKNAKNAQAKHVKPPRKSVAKEKEILIQDNTDLEKAAPEQPKPKFSDLLLKHTRQLGLNTVKTTIEETRKKQAKEKQLANQMKSLGLISEGNAGRRSSINLGTHRRSSTYTAPQPETLETLHQKSKNTIQLLMEGIEKNIADGDNIVGRIMENKPIVELTKPKDKFLKVPAELAKSTHLLSDKRDARRKIWNFSDLVKTTQKILGNNNNSNNPKAAAK